MKRTVAAAVLAGALVALLGACSGPAQQGKVTRWQYLPPTSQQVNTSCAYWSGSGGKYSSSAYCLDYNTAVEPEPQQCTLTLSSGAREDLDVSVTQCRAYVGRQWPIGGS